MSKVAPIRFLVAALVIPAFLSLAGCSEPEQAQTARTQQHSVQARISRIDPIQVTATTATTGSVVAVESVRVASRLMGYISSIAVAEGQSVKKGERLFTIDPLDIDGAVEQARLGLQQAEDAMRDAKADFTRFENLYKDDVVSRQQYEKMKLNHDIAVSRAAQAKAGLGTARGQLRYATVTSPINGVVTRKLASEGDIAAPGHPVLLVENTALMQVQTAVSETLYKHIRPGQNVMVELDDQEKALSARVASLSPAADPMTHTYTIKLDVSAPGLKSGAFARVLFPSGQRTVLRVPASAILDRAGIPGVFVVDAQNVAQYRMVRPGKVEDGQVEVLSGLNPGERVVTGNAQAVNNGDKISG